MLAYLEIPRENRTPEVLVISMECIENEIEDEPKRDNHPMDRNSGVIFPPRHSMARLIDLGTYSMRILILVAGLAFLSSAAQGQVHHGVKELPDSSIKERLGQLLVRYVRTAMAREPLSTNITDAAVVMMDEALRLDGENPEYWRLMLQLSTLTEQLERENSAIRQLLRLDPQDETIRLRRLSLAIDAKQTAPERIGVYLSLLGEKNRSAIGDAVASRLGLDLARLYRRQGNMDQFAYWLAESASIDPANHEAAAMAAGYYHAAEQDPYALAELLLAVVAANPTDSDTQITLAKLLLEHGAYRGAARVYRLATRSREKSGYSVPNGLLADMALAQWAAGDGEAALETIQIRQRAINQNAQNERRRNDPNLMPSDVARETRPLDPILSAIRLAIHRQTGSPEADVSARSLRASYERARTGAKEQSGDENAKGQLALEEAWLALWLGEDVEWAKEALDRASQVNPITESAQKRFAGWFALREGHFDEARELLMDSSIANDPTARLGIALIEEASHQSREAARELLDIVRSQSGRLMGIWASEELVRIIQARLAGDDEAMRLETLIDTLDRSRDLFPDQPTLAFSTELKVAGTTFSPFEPILVEIIITNHTQTPLTIDGFGPIRPHVVLTPLLRATDGTTQMAAQPMVIDIDRRLRLLPREQITVRINLREYALGQDLDDSLLSGSLIAIRSLCNGVAQPNGILAAGLLGSESRSLSFRVNGVRMNEPWVLDTIQELQDSLVAVNPEDFVLLCHWIKRKNPLTIGSEEKKTVASGVEALTMSYARLDDERRAWVLLMMPQEDRLEPILAMARTSESRLVRMAYLLRHVDDDGDPMLDAGRRSDDASVRAVADLLGDLLDTSNEDNARSGRSR